MVYLHATVCMRVCRRTYACLCVYIPAIHAAPVPWWSVADAARDMFVLGCLLIPCAHIYLGIRYLPGCDWGGVVAQNCFAVSQIPLHHCMSKFTHIQHPHKRRKITYQTSAPSAPPAHKCTRIRISQNFSHTHSPTHTHTHKHADTYTHAHTHTLTKTLVRKQAR